MLTWIVMPNIFNLVVDVVMFDIQKKAISGSINGCFDNKFSVIMTFTSSCSVKTLVAALTMTEALVDYLP